MLNVVLFGPPGSGKGTQATMLKDKYNLFHISTGDIFRREISSKTPLGLEVISFLDAGKLVPDEVTFKVLTTEIESRQPAGTRGILFDGYPRTIPQAEVMDRYFENAKTPVTVVLSLAVSDEELVKRLVLRGATSGRTDDSDESIIRNRLQVYTDQTLPLADYYRKQNKIVEIKGEGTVEEIFERLCDAIEGVR